MTGPTFSILVPVFRTPEAYLQELIDSVLAQTYTDWELVMVDDGSGSVAVDRILAAASADRRVIVDRLFTNQGVGAASSRALALASGTWVALLDHDDFLHPVALEVCFQHLAGDVDYLYTDEDRVTETGWIPQVKPDWSPERFRAQMYTGHLSVLRRSLVEEVGGFRPGFDGSQDYDLILRVTERARRIVHVPQILYHWRLLDTSVGQQGRQEVFDAARRALQGHLQRCGIDGEIEQIHPTGVYRVRRPVHDDPLVSIIIPTRGTSSRVRGRPRTLVVDAIRSVVDRSTYRHFEVVLVADGDTSAAVIDECRALLGDRLVLEWYRRSFNFARKINVGALAARGEYLLLLNDDTEVVTPDWMETLLGLAQSPEVGLVGCLLLDEEDRIQHAGVFYLDHGPGHIGYQYAAWEFGPMFGFGVERECSAVTAACAMIPRSLFLRLGGLSPEFPVNYNDVDLAQKVWECGQKVIMTPHAVLYHYESRSRQTERVGASEVSLLRQRWGREMAHDHYWR